MPENPQGEDEIAALRRQVKSIVTTLQHADAVMKTLREQGEGTLDLMREQGQIVTGLLKQQEVAAEQDQGNLAMLTNLDERLRAVEAQLQRLEAKQKAGPWWRFGR